MSHQDESPFGATGEPSEPADGTAPGALARRRALLAALGKGGAALAALSPLASQASRSHKLANSALPPANFGYCTVSGFQSAAISGSPAPQVCGAFAPVNFVALETLNYKNSLVSGNPDAAKLRAALNFKYGVSVFTETNVGPLLSANQPTPSYVAVLGSNVVLQWLSNNSCRALTRKNWPDDNLNALGTFKSLFSNSSDTRPLLEVLYDGVASPSPTSANCYFLAAYLSVGLTGVTLPADFNKAYVVGEYDLGSYDQTTNQYKFFQALCKSP